MSRTLLSWTSRPPPDTKPPSPPTLTPSTVLNSRSRSAASALRVVSRVTFLVAVALSVVAAVLVALAAASFLDVAVVVPLVAVAPPRSHEWVSFCCHVSSLSFPFPLHRVFSDFHRSITIHGFCYVFCVRLFSAIVQKSHLLRKSPGIRISV